MTVCASLWRFVVMISGVLAITSTATACPIAPPAGLQGITVSEKMTINGLPTAVYQVWGTAAAEKIIQQTELEWKAQGFFPQRHRQTPWLVVSAASRDCVSVLQLRDNASTQGFLSVSWPSESRPLIDKVVLRLLPTATEVDSAVQTNDHGRDGVTLVVNAQSAVSRWSEALVRNLEKNKWEKIGKTIVKNKKLEQDAERITAFLGRQQFTAIIWPDSQKTQAVITLVEAL